jgi:hypothetical protein
MKTEVPARLEPEPKQDEIDFVLLEDHPIGHTRYFLQKKLAL